MTGATGFLGPHICKLFYEDKGYIIRATTTKIGDPHKVAGLAKALGG